MIARAQQFVVRNAIWLAVVVTVFLGFTWQTIRIHGFKVGPFGFEGLQAKADKAAVEVKFARETVKLSEGLRAQEQDQGRASFGQAIARCDQRITTAAKAARIIKDVTYVPSTAPADSDSGIIGADQLRVIVGQDAGSSAAGLPSGTDNAAPDGAAAS